MLRFKCFWVLFYLLILMQEGRVKAQQPNILFIAVDDLNTDLGLYGNNVVQSPNLDKLASKSSVFFNHFVQVPTCGASRASLLTGLRPTNREALKNTALSKIAANKTETDRPESFVHHLRRHGYYTVGIGKISHSADGLVYGYREQPSNIRELPFSWDELHFDSGKWKTGWNAFFAFANGENRQSMGNRVKPYESANVNDSGYPDGLTTKLAISSLRKLQSKKQPFFLGVGYFKPHLPFNAPKKYWDLYDRETIPISKNPTLPENVNKNSLHASKELKSYKLTDEKPSLEHRVSDAYAKKLRHAYYAGISYIDTQIGMLVDEVEALGLEENTVIIVWGDHGWHLGDQQIWGKHSLFDNALKSTLIIKIPGRKTRQLQKNIKTIVETVDIYPTLLDICKTEKPYQLDGESLVGLLNNKKNRDKDIAYSYFKEGISLRTSRYRLTKYYRQEAPAIELYDHSSDPLESINVAHKHTDVVNHLLPVLEQGNTGLYE